VRGAAPAGLLPDAAEWQAFFQEVYDTSERDGAGLAMRMFLAGIGLDTVQRPATVDPDLIRRLSGNTETMLRHEVRQAPGARLDLAAVEEHSSRIVPAGGAESRQHFPYRAIEALAQRWGTRVNDLPGDHVGYWSQPTAFASALRAILA